MPKDNQTTGPYEVSFERWYKARYGYAPGFETHTVGRYEAWKASQQEIIERVSELLRWKHAVINACTDRGIAVTGQEDPAALVSLLVNFPR